MILTRFGDLWLDFRDSIWSIPVDALQLSFLNSLGFCKSWRLSFSPSTCKFYLSFTLPIIHHIDLHAYIAFYWLFPFYQYLCISYAYGYPIFCLSPTNLSIAIDVRHPSITNHTSLNQSKWIWKYDWCIFVIETRWLKCSEKVHVHYIPEINEIHGIYMMIYLSIYMYVSLSTVKHYFTKIIHQYGWMIS